MWSGARYEKNGNEDFSLQRKYLSIVSVKSSIFVEHFYTVLFGAVAKPEQSKCYPGLIILLPRQEECETDR